MLTRVSQYDKINSPSDDSREINSDWKQNLDVNIYVDYVNMINIDTVLVLPYHAKRIFLSIKKQNRFNGMTKYNTAYKNSQQKIICFDPDLQIRLFTEAE